MKSGIKPIAYKDWRTLDFHRTFGSAPAILEAFNFDTLASRPNQNADGLPEACTAYTQNDIASNEDGILYDDYEFTYRNTLNMMNAEFGEPCDMMTALKATTVYGVKNKRESVEMALANRRGPYFIVRPLGDYFEGLISAMKVKQGCLSLATSWFPSFEFPNADGTVPSPNNWDDLSRATWHDWEATGVEIINGVPYIASKSWQGAQFGQKGVIYFSRDQINKLLGTKGAGCFGQKHARPEDLKRVRMDVVDTIASYIRILITKLFSQITMQPSLPPTPSVEPVQPVQEAPANEALSWNTAEGVKHSIRVMCDEADLTYSHQYDPNISDKNILCACLQQESNFNPKAVGKLNKDGTQDFGLGQFNNGKNPKTGQAYWIGPGADFANVEEVLNDPEKNVRIMIREFKAGNLRYWSSFTTGAYKQWL